MARVVSGDTYVKENHYFYGRKSRLQIELKEFLQPYRNKILRYVYFQSDKHYAIYKYFSGGEFITNKYFVSLGWLLNNYLKRIKFIVVLFNQIHIGFRIFV